MNDTNSSTSHFVKLIAAVRKALIYCWNGVWSDRRNALWVRVIKTLNLAIRSSLDRDLQKKSMALTYSTVLAIVPAFALMFAIGRGFGFQALITNELYTYFPAQREALSTAFTFVDSYLEQASQGIFVGIGLIMLLWTVISLLSGIENAFNSIWDIHRQRSFFKKTTDYIAICLMVPVLIVCSSGVSIFMSTTLQEGLNFRFITPIINLMLEAIPFILIWLAFTLSFLMIPNAKVKFRYAAFSGALCAIAYQIVQMLFVNGQIYVSKYNAIYGSFAFLPLLLIWLQLSWLILLSGCVLTYSMQNIAGFNFLEQMEKISYSYLQKISIVIASIITDRHKKGLKPLSQSEIAAKYGIPHKLLNRIIEKFAACGLIYHVLSDNNEILIAPAFDCNSYTVGNLLDALQNEGETDFLTTFSAQFKELFKTVEPIFKQSFSKGCEIPICSLSIDDSKKI
jgi:membrane protein